MSIHGTQVHRLIILHCDFCGIEMLEKDPKAVMTISINTYKSGRIEHRLSSMQGDHYSSSNLELCPKCANALIEDIKKRLKT